MSEYGWVDPTNTANISLVDFPPPAAERDPIGLGEGAFVYVPKAPNGTKLGPSPATGLDLYDLNRVTDPIPGGRPAVYYDPVEVVEFRNAGDTGPGAVGDPTSQVIQRTSWAEIPIADLFEIKRRDVAAQDQRVRYNAADTVLAVNWWLVITQDMRFELDGINGNWLQRQINSQGWPGGPNAPWVGIYNAANGSARRVQVTDSTTWETLYLEKTNHDQATGNASNASLDALDVAYDDGNGLWANVADHDAADPVWGYPPTVDLGVAVVFFGG